MKTSLIINPQAFRAELFKCFFHYRPIQVHGKIFIAVPSYIDSDFIVSYFDVSDRDDHPAVDPRDYRNLPLLDSVYNYRFSADNCVAMRSTSPEDYYNMFFAECSLIEKAMKKVIKDRGPEDPSRKTAEGGDSWNPGDKYPEDDGEGYSKDVLIDMNGKRKDFQVGWYDHDEKEWRFHVSDTSNLDLEKLEWREI